MKAGETVADRYELVHEVGRGSSGTVFKAQDTLLNSTVCIKFLREGLAHDQNMLERFKRELLLARRLSHPGICKAFDLQKLDSGEVFLVMEFVEGEALAARLQREKKPLPVDEAMRVVKGACDAVGAAHKEGVIHRDLKPGNILLRKDGQVVVVDFGIATAADLSGLTTPGLVLGSSRYIAPERWVGDTAGPASDVWSLGVILYGCLTARLPFDGDGPFGAFEAMQKGPPDPPHVFNPDVPEAVEKVLAEALAYDTKDRFKDAGQMAEALAQVMDPITKVGLVPMSVEDSGEEEDETGALPADGKTTAEADSVPTLTGAMAKALEMPTAEGGVPSAEDDPVADARAPASIRADRASEPAASDKTRIEDMSAVLDDLTAVGDPTTDEALEEPASTAPGVDSTMLLHTRPEGAGLPKAALIVAGVAVVVLVLLWALWPGDEPPAATPAAPGPVEESPPPKDPPDPATEPSTKIAETPDPPSEQPEDAPEESWDFGEEDLNKVTDRPATGEKRKPKKRKPTKSTTKKPAKTRVNAAQAERGFHSAERTARAAMKKKGLLRGDAKNVDALLAEMKRAAKRGDYKKAEAKARAASSALEKVSVDKSFVTKKIARFNRAYDTVKDEAKRKKLGQAVAAVSGPFRRGDYVAANRALNRAFALLR